MINDISLPWSTEDLFKGIDKKSKKKSRKKSKKKTSESWSNEYSDVDRSPKKPKNSKRK
jgi:hypothetical protein